MLKRISFFYLVLFWCSLSEANQVHLGLKINYQTGMSHVEKKDTFILSDLIKISEFLPHVRFLISGHTDFVGPYEMNVELSKGRAENLRTLLINKKLTPSRIQTKWFSFDAPIETNETEEGRKKNRRVVATIYGLSLDEAEKLVRAAKRSKSFYVIKVENDLVVEYVKDVLNSDLEKVAPLPIIENPKIIENSAIIEEDLRLQNGNEPVVSEPKKDKTPKVKKESIFKDKQRYYFGYEISDNQLDANSSGFRAIWITDFNHALNLGYQFNFTRKLWIGFEASYKFRNYRLDDNLIYNWDGSSPNLISFALISDYTLNEKLNLGFDIKYIEENFVIYNGLDIDLIKASLMNLALRLDYKILNTKKYTSRLKLRLENPILGFGELDPSGSLNYYGGVDLSFNKLHKKYELNLGLIYGIRNLENVQNEQTENYLGFEIKVRNKKW